MSRPSAVPGYLAMFVALGIAMSVIGPALPHLRERTGVTVGTSGWWMAAMSGGYIVGSYRSGRRYDRGRVHRLIITAATVAVAALAGVALAPNFATVVASFTVLGVACGAMDVGGNTLVVWSEPPERTTSTLNALHLCFGIGALTAPLAVDRSVESLGSLVIPSMSLAVVVAVASALVARGRVPSPRTPTSTGSGTEHGRRILVLAGAFLFLYVGLEAGFVGWVATFAEEIRLAGGTTSGGELTSVFFLGFTLSRLASIPIARRVRPATLLVSSCVGSLVAITVLALWHGDGANVWFATFAFGALLGPQYATLVAYGDQRLHLSGRDTALIVAASGAGGLVVPFTIGWLLDGVGAAALPWAATVVNALALCVAVAVIVAARRLDGAAHPSPAPVSSVP